MSDKLVFDDFIFCFDKTTDVVIHKAENRNGSERVEDTEHLEIQYFDIFKDLLLFRETFLDKHFHNQL